MNSLKSKIAYLKGYMEGLDIDKDSKEGKMFTEVINVMGLMSEKIESLEKHEEEIEDYIETIDGELTMVKDEIYGYEDVEFLDYDYENEEDDHYIEISCANCNETIFVEREILNSMDGIRCPSCHGFITCGSKKEHKSND